MKDIVRSNAVASIKCNKCHAKLSKPYISLVYLSLELAIIPLILKLDIGFVSMIIIGSSLILLLRFIDLNTTPLIVRAEPGEEKSVLWYNLHFFFMLSYFILTVYIISKFLL